MGCCLHLIDVNVIMGVNEAKGIGRVIYKRGSNLFRERGKLEGPANDISPWEILC